MGKMSWLAYLIENDMQKELREVLTPVAQALNKPYGRVLASFTKDYKGNYKRKPLFTKIEEVKKVTEVIKSTPEYKLAKEIVGKNNDDTNL